MEKIGAVAIFGGGIAGVQAALDLAESGFQVYIIETSSSIGGVMAQLDKTFPTNDCSMCILSPKLVEAGRHVNIDILTKTQLVGVSGEVGNFTLSLTKKTRYVEETKCTGCGICYQECPLEAIDVFNEGISITHAVSVPFPQSVPLYYQINKDICIGCGICEAVCKTHAINYAQDDHSISLQVGAIILALGFDEFDPSTITTLGYSKYTNVITSIEFERILSASGPYSGLVLRPSDGEIPRKIAFLQCVGSRDCHHGHEYCSSVCCMYTAKEAVIAKEHQPQVNPTIFSMDIRAYGKDFDKYIERAQKEYGIRFIKSRVGSLSENNQTQDIQLTYEMDSGEILREDFQLVVLAVGLEPPKSAQNFAKLLNIELNSFGFCKTNPFNPIETSRNGIFVCGVFESPKDIPDSVVQATAAAGQISALLSSVRGSKIQEKEYPLERNLSDESPRIGVFICHCGINIGGVVNVPEVLKYTKNLPDIVYCEQNLYTCSADTQTKIKEKILEHQLNRVVVASCTPRTHESLFQNTLREAGLNKYLFQMTNIRDQCSWVHMHEPKAATEKAQDLVTMAITRVRNHQPLKELPLEINPSSLVIGGGVAGLSAAINLANQGYHTTLIEESTQLGGFAAKIYETIEGYDIKSQLELLIQTVCTHPKISVFTNAKIQAIHGYLGNFHTKLHISPPTGSQDTVEVTHGTLIVATGAKEFIPQKYQYGQDARVITQLQLQELLFSTKNRLNLPKTITMIQCVGSRDSSHPYCSRICCITAIKNAIKIKRASPTTEIFIIYRDIRTYGFKEVYYRQARELGIVFIRRTEEFDPEVLSHKNELLVKINKSDGEIVTIPSGLLVLSTGMIALEENKALSQLLKVPLNEDQFFLEAHVKLRPVDFSTEGIFLCGTARAPANIEESITQGIAAASRAGTLLSKPIIYASGATAYVQENLCTGCKICIRLCPYNAIERDSTGVAHIISAICKGCGICAASCPEKAITSQYFTREQILAEIHALGGNLSEF